MIPMTSRRIVIVAATVWLSVIHGLCHELYFGLMTGEHGIEEAKNGIEVALRSINQRSNILPGYTLKYTDSHVSI